MLSLDENELQKIAGRLPKHLEIIDENRYGFRTLDWVFDGKEVEIKEGCLLKNGRWNLSVKDELMDFKSFLKQIAPEGKIIREMDVPVSEEEEKLFFLALYGTKKYKPILIFKNIGRKDKFVIKDIDVEARHLFRMYPDGTISIVREYITQIAVFSDLYYYEYYEPDCPEQYIKFACDYEHDPTKKLHDWPMDIIRLSLDGKPYEYIWVNTVKPDVDSFIKYLATHSIYDLDVHDKDIKHKDNIRRVKCFWATRVPYLEVVYPGSVGILPSFENYYEINYLDDGRIIIDIGGPPLETPDFI